MATVDRLNLKSGNKVVLDGNLYIVISADHRSPGKGQAFTVVKLKDYREGKVIERTFRGMSDAIEVAEFEQRTCQFLYEDPDGYHFMDLGTYDQFILQEEFLGFQKNFLIAEAEVVVAFWNEAPVGLDLPGKMVFEVTETMDDVVKGNTSSSITKDATLETGHTIQVPPFVKTGDKVRVNTETGEYVERA